MSIKFTTVNYEKRGFSNLLKAEGVDDVYIIPADNKKTNADRTNNILKSFLEKDENSLRIIDLMKEANVLALAIAGGEEPYDINLRYQNNLSLLYYYLYEINITYKNFTFELIQKESNDDCIMSSEEADIYFPVNTYELFVYRK